jgi:hypothetical protein
VLSLFVSRDRLQRDLDLADRVNTLLVQGVGTIYLDKGPEAFVNERLRPVVAQDDLGLRTRFSAAGEAIIESRAGLIPDALAAQIAEIANRERRSPRQITYVVNAIKLAIARFPTRPSPELIASQTGLAPRIMVPTPFG